MHNSKQIKKKFNISIIIAIIFSINFLITTFAFIGLMTSVDENIFYMGSVDIDLNDGKSIIEEHEYIFEPGMTVKKEFYIQNKSTWDVYYRIYFDYITGGLADVIQITIRDNKQDLFIGKASELKKELVDSASGILRLNEKKELEIIFHYPEESKSSTENNTLTFTLCADAVQTKNNSNKEFD